MRNFGLLIGIALGASSAGAQNAATMVEDIGEDIAMYRLVGQYCGLPILPDAHAIARLLMALDLQSAEKGATRAGLMLDGAKVRTRKSEICAAARSGRPKLEAQLPQTLRGLESLQRIAAAQNPVPRAPGAPLTSSVPFRDYAVASEDDRQRWASAAARSFKLPGWLPGVGLRRCLDALDSGKSGDLELGSVTAICGAKLAN